MEKHSNRFDSAVRGMPTDRTPIWFMRQAGRYLPEYREIRKKLSFDEMLANADVATEITLQPIRRFDLDAAVIFADIMTILNGLDIPFNFASGGPALEFHSNDALDVQKLDAQRLLGNQTKFAPFLQSIRNVRATLPPEKAVIGFAASPFTLLSYLLEGTTSKTHNKTRAFMLSQPAQFYSMMSAVADCTIEYLKLQISAGVSAVQLFESWGDVLSSGVYQAQILPHVTRIVTEVNPHAPVILYDKGASLHIDVLRPMAIETGTVLSVDWRIDIAKLSDLRIQGNLDPAALESDPDSVRTETKKILLARAGQPGHVFNLGHGITPQAKLECVEAMVETVQASSGILKG
jgi:uroporphyrinogen decarboxylase